MIWSSLILNWNEYSIIQLKLSEYGMVSLYWISDWSEEARSGLAVAVTLIIATLLFHSPRKVLESTLFVKFINWLKILCYTVSQCKLFLIFHQGSQWSRSFSCSRKNSVWRYVLLACNIYVCYTNCKIHRWSKYNYYCL